MRGIAIALVAGCGGGSPHEHPGTMSSSSSPTTATTSPVTSPATTLGSGRSFPDTSARIAVLADQLPSGMTAAQQQFAASHYVGTQKLTLDLSKPLRALNPDFLVLETVPGAQVAVPPVGAVLLVSG